MTECSCIQVYRFKKKNQFIVGTLKKSQFFGAFIYYQYFTYFVGLFSGRGGMTGGRKVLVEPHRFAGKS